MKDADQHVRDDLSALVERVRDQTRELRAMRLRMRHNVERLAEQNRRLETTWSGRFTNGE